MRNDFKHTNVIDGTAWRMLESGGHIAVARVHLAVAGFIVLSGFVMQWSQGARSPGCGRGLALFLFKRLDRVLLTTWIGMASSQL
eukprot:1989802-Prymnesium_polylepis.1